jgi:hypothetical protein
VRPMFKFYLDENFRLSGTPQFPAQFVQYSTEDVEVHIPFANLGITVIMNVIRPDGFKTNEMFMELVGEDPEEAGIYIYKTTLTPYHTALIPGTQSQGTMIVSFMLKQFEDEILTNVLSSPITKIPVERSIEPNAEFLPTSVAEDFAARITSLETVSFDHTLLSSQSRAQANQHPIGAITDLEPKVTVHVGRYEPEDPADTWLDTKGTGDDEIIIEGEWYTIAGTPVIALNVNFSVGFPGEQGVPTDSMLRLVIIGNNFGEIARQEYLNQPNNYIQGQALVYRDIVNEVRVQFTLEPIIQNDRIVAYRTVQFQNIGNLFVSNFQAHALEVFE